MDCNWVAERQDAHAVGALEPDEWAEVERHLAGCPDCRRRAAELADVAAALPWALAAASPVQPPTALKARILASVPALPGPAPAGTGRGATTEGRASSETGRIASAGGALRPRPLRLSDRWRRPWGRSGALARLAAVVLLLLALGWSVRLGLALERERSRHAELAALVGQQEIVLEVVDSDKTERRVLLTTRPDACEPGTCPYGKVFTRSDLPHVVAMAARLPAPTADQAYHLWLTNAGRTELAGTLTLDEKGFGLLVFDADHAGPTYDAAEVTLQPEGASTPSGDPVLRWTASSP